jgi:hypothetical protein
VAIAIYRLILLDRGALAFVDGTFYFTSVVALQSLQLPIAMRSCTTTTEFASFNSLRNRS